MSSTSLEERIRRAVRERIEIVPYDAAWPKRFEAEAGHLRAVLAPHVLRIEHFGSTAVPGLAAKPVIDVLVGVESATVAREEVAPRLERLGYDYFWRTDGPEPYAWFIRRDASGARTHHVHVVEPDSTLWERLLFRDYLREHPDVARRYEALKYRLAGENEQDREAYTQAKGEFVREVTAAARRHDGGR